MRFAICPFHLSKVLCLPHEVLHANHLSKPEDLMLQNATPLRNERPNLLISLMNMSLVLRLPRKMHLCRSSSHIPRLPTLLKLLQNPHVLVTFDKVQNPLRRNDIWTPKVLRTWGVLCILTSKCALCHDGVHFFDIWTSKSAPSMVCFVHFDFEMCFAPQRRALFGHRNFQKCSNVRCFVHFDFEMCFVPWRRAFFWHLNFQKCS